MKRIIAAVGVMLAMLIALFGVQVNATATPVEKTAAVQLAKKACPDGTCQNLTHYSPDDGFDDCFGIEGIKYRTDGTYYHTTGSVCEGHSAYGDGWASAEQVYVKAGTQIKCLDPYVWWTQQWQIQWDSTGWHSVGTYPSYFSYTCVYQLD